MLGTLFTLSRGIYQTQSSSPTVTQGSSNITSSHKKSASVASYQASIPKISDTVRRGNLSSRTIRETKKTKTVNTMEIREITFFKREDVTEDILVQAAQFFNDNYGIWDSAPPDDPHDDPYAPATRFSPGKPGKLLL